MLPTGLKMPVRQNNSGPVSQPGGAACFGKEHRKQLRIYLLRPLQFFHRTCTINPNTWVERDRYEEEKNRESDHGPYHRGHRHCKGERGTDDENCHGGASDHPVCDSAEAIQIDFAACV